MRDMNRRKIVTHGSLSAVVAVMALTASLGLSATFAKAQTPVAKAAKADHVVLVLGDSLSAEYGLQRGAGWVALMEQRIGQEKLAARVVNASISGDTTSGGRSRLPALLKQHQPTVVIVELGGNDALRGLSLNMTRDNLSNITRISQSSGAKVVLAGMQIPPNYGRSYGEGFAKLFSEVAAQEKSALVPFLLKGVGDVADAEKKYFQSDRIHPNEAAHPLILGNVWPVVSTLLRK